MPMAGLWKGRKDCNWENQFKKVFMKNFAGNTWIQYHNAILWTCHFMNMSFYELVILWTCHFMNMSFYVILSTWYSITFLFYFLNIFWTHNLNIFQLVITLTSRLTSLSNYKLIITPHSQFRPPLSSTGQFMNRSFYQLATLLKCHFGILSFHQLVNSMSSYLIS